MNRETPRATYLAVVGLALAVLMVLGSGFQSHRRARLEHLHRMEVQARDDRAMHAELAARCGPVEASAHREVVRWNDELLRRVRYAERRVLPPRGVVLPEPVSRETSDLLRLR